jgi:flavin reductase (DIM6/NTAB) family NADH-FMN oxidoreductase RutF
MGLEIAPVESAGFRAALGKFASSVNVITMWDDDGAPLGMTATAFSSVSADPMLVLICINRNTRTYEHIVRSGRFGVNILGSVAQDISDYCARSGADKSLDRAWLTSEDDWHSPALSGALAYLDCKVDRDIHAGTHAVLIGAVGGIGLSPAEEHEPLLYFKGKYRHLRTAATFSQPAPLPILLEEIEALV